MKTQWTHPEMGASLQEIAQLLFKPEVRSTLQDGTIGLVDGYIKKYGLKTIGGLLILGEGEFDQVDEHRIRSSIFELHLSTNRTKVRQGPAEPVSWTSSINMFIEAIERGDRDAKDVAVKQLYKMASIADSVTKEPERKRESFA